MKLRYIIAGLVAASLVCAVFAACKKEAGKSSPGEGGSGGKDAAGESAVESIARGTILHAWCWSFDTIKDSMADIAAAGYTAIQTSPANAVVVGGDGGMQLMGKGKWYYQYQPTDWTVGNYQLGTEQDLRDMCAEADRYGIKIIVDVVPNHTTSDIGAVSQSLIDAAGGTDRLYHKNSTKKIVNFSSRIECTSYSLSGLPDVNTEQPGFQDYFINYLNTLIADGADGFRYDTAKHIALPDDPREDESLPNNFWERVTTETNTAVFNYGEVLQGDNERIEAYIDAIGRTTASDYGKRLRGLITGRMLNAGLLSDFMSGGRNELVTWVESHDNYTDGTSVQLTDTQIVLGWAVIAAQGEGTPLFFVRPYGSSPTDMWGRMNRIGAAGSPLYRSAPVAAVNRFRNAMAGKPTAMTNISDNTVLMIERGDAGAVLINYKSDESVIFAPTALPDGEYTDRSGMNGTFTVSGGVMSGSVAAETIAVLYNEGYTEPVRMPEVAIDADTFVIDGGLTVTLRVSGADVGEYTLDGSTAEYHDGDRLTLSEGTEELRVTAKNTEGEQTVMTYFFTGRQTVPAGSRISFTKPDAWGDTIYVYVYDETGTRLRKNKLWPGEEMTPDGGGTYTYTLTEDWDSALVIFSDGENQYPAAMEPGVTLAEDMSYSVPGR